jgi:hypothetical protein
VSLRKSPERTSELLDAARSNAQHSTGPRSEAGKQNSKMNAVRHGERADPRNHYWVMLALGEDPEEFEFLKKELLLSYGPGEILWQKQIDDLARLYWRRQRLERAQEGVMRRAMLAVEDRQHRRRQELAEATFDASQSQEFDMESPAPTDPGVRLRWRLSWLKVIGEQVKQRVFEPRQASWIESADPQQQGWRQARLAKLLRLFAAAVQPSAPDGELEESRSRQNEALQNPAEGQYEELLRLLEEEMAWVQEEFEYAEKVHEEEVAIERDACLAPEGEQWQMMLRREAALDRSIDRKVRILLHMRKEYQALRNTPPPDETLELEDDIAEMLGLDLPTEEPVTPEASSCQVPPATVAEAAGEGTGSRPATGGSGLPHPAAHEQEMNEPGMSMKTKRWAWRIARKAGMFWKRQEAISTMREWYWKDRVSLEATRPPRRRRRCNLRPVRLETLAICA